jgi:hypothetical protein
VHGAFLERPAHHPPFFLHKPEESSLQKLLTIIANTSDPMSKTSAAQFEFD